MVVKMIELMSLIDLHLHVSNLLVDSSKSFYMCLYLSVFYRTESAMPAAAPLFDHEILTRLKICDKLSVSGLNAA